MLAPAILLDDCWPEARHPRRELTADSRASIEDNGRFVGVRQGEAAVDAARPAGHSEALARQLAAAASGDRVAFKAVYEATSAKLFGVAMALVRRRDLAEEVLQEAYLTIWRKASLYAPEKGTPEAWMAAIVRHRAIDRLRAGQRNAVDLARTDEDFEARLAAVAEPGAADDAWAASLRQCLERLGDKQRQAILLAFYFGLTHEELAVQMDAPVGTVKSWVRRGLLQIRDMMEA